MKQYICFFVMILCHLTYGQELTTSPPDTIITKQSSYTDIQKKTWWAKDIIEDTIPGISLEKAYRKLIGDKKGTEIIVAVLDTKLDINHEDLINQLWINKNEIAGNGIDDDQNGYVDDINGWDFLSNPNGAFLKYENKEIARIVRKYRKLYEHKEEKDIKSDQIKDFIQYNKAKAILQLSTQNNEEEYQNMRGWIENLKASKIILDSLHPNIQYNTSTLDSLKVVHRNDSILLTHINYHSNKIAADFTDESIHSATKELEDLGNTTLNPDYEERKITGDNPDDINDRYYGYNQVYGDVPFQHATAVTGVLAATRDNNIGIQGLSNAIKIMPVVMVATGDEHDKDVAIAIRYAVDNGAKVINMSWRKYFSPNADWVYDAIRYAATKDVLMITAAGNDGQSIEMNNSYPNDYINGKEFVHNFMVVGASSYTPTKNLIAFFSNYGKNNVDIFAPGRTIYSTEIENEYGFSNGTSIAAPIVAGVAALVRSYYPKLSASQVKQILMKSGISYNIDVEIKLEDGSKKLVPFSELSKSGKIVNAYNALLMAEKMSKK